MVDDGWRHGCAIQKGLDIGMWGRDRNMHSPKKIDNEKCAYERCASHSHSFQSYMTRFVLFYKWIDSTKSCVITRLIIEWCDTNAHTQTTIHCSKEWNDKSDAVKSLVDYAKYRNVFRPFCRSSDGTNKSFDAANGNNLCRSSSAADRFIRMEYCLVINFTNIKLGFHKFQKYFHTHTPSHSKWFERE